MSKIKNGWLDQYGAEPFKFKAAGTEGVNHFQDVTRTSLFQIVKE